jgi:death on curing protein
LLYFTEKGPRKLHDAIVNAYGGESGTLQQGLLESAALRPRTVIAGEEQYIGKIRKASALGYAIITWHPFVDGNKRTALFSMSLFLYLNDITMAEAMDSLKYLVLLASGRLTEDQFTPIIRRWCSRWLVSSFLKTLQYQWWPRLEMKFFEIVGYRFGYEPYRRRQLGWMAAGNVETLERILKEYEVFRKAGYPKPFNLKLVDEDFFEE